jgi:hypothetical protein
MLDLHLIEADLQFLGQEHGDRGVGALPHLDIGHDQGHTAIARDADEGIGREGPGFGGFGGGLPRG